MRVPALPARRADSARDAPISSSPNRITSPAPPTNDARTIFHSAEVSTIGVARIVIREQSYGAAGAGVTPRASESLTRSRSAAVTLPRLCASWKIAAAPAAATSPMITAPTALPFPNRPREASHAIPPIAPAAGIVSSRPRLCGELQLWRYRSLNGLILRNERPIVVEHVELALV
jgi:hypothetical protein